MTTSRLLYLLLLPELLAGGELPAQSPHPRIDRHGDPLPHGAIVRMGTVRYRQAGLLAVAFSPDGKTLAVGGYDQDVHLIEAATGREVRVLGGPASWVNGVAFVSGGKVVVASSVDRTIRWWDTATGKEVRRVKQAGDLHALAAASDGKTLAWADGGAIRLVDAATGKTIRSLSGHRQSISALAFGGRLLASASDLERSVRLWSLVAGKVVHRMKSEADHFFCPVALSPDGKLLATHGAGYRVCLTDTATGKEVFCLGGHTWFVEALAFSPDGKLLASGSADATVRVWDLSTRRPLLCLFGRQPAVNALAWSADGKLLASASPAAHLGRSLCLWDTKAGIDLSPGPAHQGPVHALTVPPDGQALVSGGPDATLRLWGPSTGKQIRCLRTGDRHIVTAAYSRDGKYLVAHLLNAPVAVWEAHSGKAVRLPAGLDDRTFALAPRGGLIATAPSGEGPVSLYDFPSFKLRRRLELPAPMKQVSLVFSPDGALLAASDAENHPGVMVLWETATGRQRLLLKETGGHVSFSPDGRALAVWSRHGPAELREVATGRVLRRFEPLELDSVFAVAFSPDGSMAAVGGGSFTTMPGKNAIRVWETATGRERCCLLGHRAAVKALVFFPDGRRLASGSEDSTALVWDLHHAVLGEQLGKPVSAKELEAAWDRLAVPDADRSYRALCRLACEPDRAVAEVEKQLRRRDRGPTLGQLIAALDSDDFQEREKASQELARRGRDAETALRRALASNPSPEVRWRIAALLKKLKDDLSGSYLQWRRAIELLEQAGTPQAIALLRRLADGDAASGLVREAKAALERLAHRQPR